MATSLRRDGTHVSGKEAATTADPTHAITTVMAAAAATRNGAGHECSMADGSTRPTCTAVVGYAPASVVQQGHAAGELCRQARTFKLDPKSCLAVG